MYDPELLQCIDKAFSQLHERLQESGPMLRKRITQWIENTYPTGKPQEAFINPLSFPILLLPWFAQDALLTEPDADFQTDLVYSTVNGYYYIRLMDNIMDGHGEDQLPMLPALNFFHTQFQQPYQKHFQYNHPFWGTFHTIWMHSAEVTIRDASLEEIDRDKFVEVSAQKTSAAKIPIAAVLYYNDQIAHLDIWSSFVDLFGCWHQMWNDIFDWIKDTQGQVQTYFLSESQRRKQPNEPVADWVMREGLAWGFSLLDDWMVDLRNLTKQLDSPELEKYLIQRDEKLSKQKLEAIQALEKLGKLLTSLKDSLRDF